MACGLFVGLTTLDLIYLTPQFPEPNQKIVAEAQLMTAGGPATNAAIAFAHFGHETELLSVIGQHPLTQLIRADLRQHQVHSVELHPSWQEAPPLSSILVTQATGERAVISVNATRCQATLDDLAMTELRNSNLVLMDGHQMAVSRAIAQRAQARKIPVVVDGGSWKVGYETILPYVDYAICSANFRPPGCDDTPSVFAYLQDQGIAHIAMTHGPAPIQVFSQGDRSEIPIRGIKAIDTLAAGDIFHGAFCHFILHQSFIAALSRAAEIATLACQSLGPRAWMEVSDPSSVSGQ